ncbi:MAG: AAA family ATPase, partial [Chloroflexota bacterium]|nr:AAA family ATPase [Chloroflexota bacterium]
AGMADLAGLLRRHREAVGLTQEELAERAGLSARGVSDLERGLRGNPYPATLRRLAVALDLAPEERAALLAAPHANLAAESSDLTPASSRPAEGAYLGARPLFRLVGREREQAEVTDAFEAALAGSGRLLLLSGEAGIGKTRLAQELAALASRRGCLVATGRCYEAQLGVAFYYPFMEALATVYAAAPAELREALPERWPYLQRLLPDIFPVAIQPTSEAADQLHRLLRAVTGFLHGCAARAREVLLLDDVQWADHASLDLLLYLVRHTRSEPLLIAATCRELGPGSGQGLRRALVDLQREGLPQRVRLQQLSRSATGDLLAERLGAGGLSAELLDLIHGATEGNPFFAIEVLQTLRARGRLVQAGQRWVSQPGEFVSAPDTVRESILERHAHLSPTAAAAIDAATALGPAFLVEELAAVTGLDEDAVKDALVEAARAGFIRLPAGPATRSASDDSYAFVHGLSHQALYERVPPHRRRRLRLRAAEVLKQLRPTLRARRAAELARHLQLADEPAQAVPYVLLAGDQAEALFAHHEAAQHYRAARHLAAELGDRAAEAQALLGLGRSLLAAGHPRVHSNTSRPPRRPIACSTTPRAKAKPWPVLRRCTLPAAAGMPASSGCRR